MAKRNSDYDRGALIDWWAICMLSVLVEDLISAHPNYYT